jgi:hypothetical protein
VRGYAGTIRTEVPVIELLGRVPSNIEVSMCLPALDDPMDRRMAVQVAGRPCFSAAA